MSDPVLAAVGNTPLVQLHGLGVRNRVLLKLESLNPGGSIKDRTALAMVRAAEASGELRAGATIVESSSGNTGVGLALIGSRTGHPVVIVVGQSTSAEKVEAIRGYGARVEFADWEAAPESPDNPRTVAERIAASIPGSWWPQQFDNQANPQAHYHGTGPEIWRQTSGALTHFVASVGTGGTISGAGRYFKEASRGAVRVHAADPAGSVYSGAPAGRIIVDGVGNTWPRECWPSTFDPAVVDGFQVVDDAECYATLHFLQQSQGLCLGPSSGLAVAAARRVADAAPVGSLVVAIAPDTGQNYASKAYDRDWLAAQGLQLSSGLPPLPVPAR
ncbi:MAG: cysteine synthase family protein [Renibacterium sp.]|nr:cysteine synthase family protein [Renibacterium sp.]